MILIRKHFYLLPIVFAGVFLTSLQAQQEEGTPTQTLIAIESKGAVAPNPSNIILKVENKRTPLRSITAVPPSGAQVALLIDDGLRTGVGRELGTLRSFAQSLPKGTEIFIGYMQNGRVVPSQDFTTNYAAAAQALRLPTGMAGSSASPYFCVSDFVKNWPTRESDNPNDDRGPVRKARIVLMITNGVDPYNGSTSLMNQNSPYVSAAVTDAQRAGIPIYSIYFSDAGMGGGQASFSGQGYLAQIAEGTGGRAYYQGTGSPVSMSPFLKQFKEALSKTYVVTFDAPGDKKLVRLNVSTNLSKAKVRSADQVRPGAQITAINQQ